MTLNADNPYHCRSYTLNNMSVENTFKFKVLYQQLFRPLMSGKIHNQDEQNGRTNEM